MEPDLSEATGDGSDPFHSPAAGVPRHVLESLQDAGVPLSLADIALELARQETDVENDVWTRAECHWVRLYHNHVPTLEEAGLVEYDRDRGTVSLTQIAAQRFDEISTVQVEA